MVCLASEMAGNPSGGRSIIRRTRDGPALACWARMWSLIAASNAILKDVAAKNGDAQREAGCCGPCLCGAWSEPAAGV
jgi:hypothetical protein